MSRQCSVSVDGTKARITVVGRFDFNAHTDFRTACAEVGARNDVREVDVDLGSVDYMDSSALGMLLLLKDQTEAVQRQLKLIRTPPAVRRILRVANFDRLLAVT